jgi:PAS domain S-box-containing protein
MIPEKAPITDRRQRRTLLLGLGFLVFCVLQLLAYQLWLNYQEEIVDAETKTRNYAAIFETRLDATLRRTDAILQGLSRSIPAQALARPASASDAASLGETLDAHLLYFDDLAGLRVFDRRGDMRYSSNGAHTAPTNVADRDYFRFLQNRPQSGLLFSEVIVSRITGRPSLIIARALQDPHGVFLGLVTAALDLDHYVEIFRLVDVGNNGVISFRRSDDHRQVVRWPSGPGKMNQELDPGHPLRPPMARGDRTGTLHFASQTDGVPRIYSFHRLEHYPFYFIIGVSFDDVLAGWRTRAQVIGACGFLLLALFAALLLRLWRSEAREALVVASLVDSERQQRDNSKRLQIFERLVENAGQGIGMAHPDGTITYANPALRCLLDLPVNAAYNDYSFNHFYSGENSRRLREEVLPTLLQTGQWTGELELSSLDGRSIPAIHTLFVVRNAAGEAPIIANVLADISERRQAEQVSRLLLQAVEYSPVAIVITSRHGEIEYVNPSFTQMTGFCRDEAIGQNTRFLKSGETPPETYQQLWQTLLEGKIWNGILHNRRKNGELFWEQTSHFAGFWRSRRGYALPRREGRHQRAPRHRNPLASAGRSIRTQRRGDHGQRPRQPHPGGQPGLLSPHRLCRRRGARRRSAPVVVGALVSGRPTAPCGSRSTAAATGRARSGTAARTAASTRNGCRSRPSRLRRQHRTLHRQLRRHLRAQGGRRKDQPPRAFRYPDRSAQPLQPAGPARAGPGRGAT